MSLFSELPENLDLLPTKILILFQQIYTLNNRVIKQREYRAIERAIEKRCNFKKKLANIYISCKKIVVAFQQIYKLYNIIKQREYRAIHRAIELRSKEKKKLANRYISCKKLVIAFQQIFTM